MNNLIDRSFDKEFENIQNLTWLPWVGSLYNKGSRKLLIVGESHYTFGNNDIEYLKRHNEATQNKELTRECIYESAINIEWQNNTFDNIHRVFLKTNDFERDNFWKNVAYYNFIPRLMDYRKKERPEWVDFYKSWKIFIEIIKLLKPTDCIFIGVTASNSFNLAMQELKIDHTQVKWLEGIGTAYGRFSKIILENFELKITSIQHASQMFSWTKWHEFLQKQNPEIIYFLRSIVLTGKYVEQTEAEKEQKKETRTKDIPWHLSHKPIIACNYIDYTGDEDDDAKYLSIGHAQFNQKAASVKLFRHTGNKWSRQSEEYNGPRY